MSDHLHRGARPPGPFNAGGDRRILELDEALRGVEAIGGALPALGFFRDATRSAAAKHHALGNPGHFSRGTVIHAIPGVNWYKVQVGDGAGWVAACLLSHGTMTPLGPRDVGMVNPNDDVILFKPRGLNHGFIVGVIPPYAAEGSVLCPDWLVQGGGTGFKLERGHKFPIKDLYKSGGVVDWSCQRPQDQTPLERGWVSPFGPALTIDDYMIQARVNEMAGLWATLVDGWVRLAGQQLLIESPVHEVDAGDDEGEARYFHGTAAYPHEALGLYRKGQVFAFENDDKKVQYAKGLGKLDLREEERDLQPIYRYQEYGGYLGQGRLRLVARPALAGESEKRLFADRAGDDGLFMESIGLDGTYSLVSAKSLHIGKRCRIVVPKQKKPAAGDGDDAAADNYKFSSLFGGGPEHKVGDVKVTGTPRSVLTVAAVLDVASYDLNWRALHPFHYHAGDYETPQARAGALRVQEHVDYGGGFFVADPTPKRLTIDHRYGRVDYFERESFLRFNDDGSVHLAGGAGEELVFAGGNVFVAAPKGIHALPGTDFTVKADQVVLCAKGSVDLSSSEKDVRLKAEGNMQLLAGNGGTGGILAESKGTGTQQVYKNKYGEDVVSNGVVFRAAQSAAAVYGKDIYLRTGGADLGEGDILLDASRGKRRVQVYGKEFHTYTTSAVTFNFGPLEDNSTVRRAYYFDDENAIADVTLLLGGKLVAYEGGGGTPDLIVDGGVYGTKSFATAGVMADKKGMFLGKVPPGFAGTIDQVCSSAAGAADQVAAIGSERHKVTIVEKYYQADQLGNEDLIPQLKFSFRDPPGSQRQYRSDGFALPEPRWQQLVRFGMATGGTPWTERPVLYQGSQTYPWPGKKAWVDDPSMLRLTSLTMFDAAAGTDGDRPGAYEQPEVGSLGSTAPDGQYKLNR